MGCYRVVIVGGGAAGLLTGAALLRELPEGLITIVEPTGELGRGPAYRCENDLVLLNVRAGGMSAIPSDPGHFVRWLRKKGYRSTDMESRFFPRRLYGEYLTDYLAESQKVGLAGLKIVESEAVSVVKTGSGVRLGLKDGQELEANAVIFATGNLPPKLPPALAKVAHLPQVVTNPWVPGILKSVQPHHRVLFVGTGLTAIDAITMLGRVGHKGQLYARSRRGLIPQPHKACAPTPVSIDPDQNIFLQVIRAARLAEDEWRSVIDGMRPQTRLLWQSMPWRERQKFFARFQPYWDIHRHRSPSKMASFVAALVNSGHLDVGKGRLKTAEVVGDAIKVSFESEELVVDWVVNCTGPNIDLKGAALPIMESAVANGLAEYDPLGLGLMVDDLGRTDNKGLAWALGALCRGCRLETTAIPEIRTQAACIAAGLKEMATDRQVVSKA